MAMSEQMRGLISEAVHQVFMYITDNIDTFAEEYALTDEDINNLRNAQQLMVVVKDAAAQSVEQVLEQTGGMAPVDPSAYAAPETSSAYEQVAYDENAVEDVNASAYMHMADAPVQGMMAGDVVADAEEPVAVGASAVGIVEEEKTEEDEEIYEEEEDDDEFVDEDDDEYEDDDEDDDDEFVDEDDDEYEDDDEDAEDDDDGEYEEEDEAEDDVMQPVAMMGQEQAVSAGELVNPYDANRAQLLDMLQRSLVDYEFARRLRQFFGIA